MPRVGNLFSGFLLLLFTSFTFLFFLFSLLVLIDGLVLALFCFVHRFRAVFLLFLYLMGHSDILVISAALINFLNLLRYQRVLDFYRPYPMSGSPVPSGTIFCK